MELEMFPKVGLKNKINVFSFFSLNGLYSKFGQNTISSLTLLLISDMLQFIMVGTWIAPQVAAAPPSYLYYSLSPTQKWHLCFHIAHHQTYDKFLDGKFKYSSSQFERTFLLPPTQNGTRVSISLTSRFLIGQF